VAGLLTSITSFKMPLKLKSPLKTKHASYTKKTTQTQTQTDKQTKHGSHMSRTKQRKAGLYKKLVRIKPHPNMNY
jgi:hypothetical protein